MPVIRSKLSVILPTIKARLLAGLNADPSHVTYSIGGHRVGFRAVGDWSATIIPRTQATAEICRLGGGRLDTRVTRRVAIELSSRLYLDEADDAEAWLLNATLGHCDREHAAIDALEGWSPQIGDDWLVYQPLKLQPASAPMWPDDKHPEWGTTSIEFDLCYTLDLSA